MIITVCHNPYVAMLSTGFESLDHSIGGLLRKRVNTSFYDTPYARTYLSWNIVSSCLKRGGLVYYIDLDMKFTAFLEHEARPIFPLDDLVIFNPGRGEIQDILAAVCSLKAQGPDLIVLDSVSMFYHLFEANASSSEANRMLGLCLSLMQSYASRMNVAVLVSGLTRKKSSGSSRFKFFPGGNVLLQRSDLVLSVTSGLGYIEIQVVKHWAPSLQQSIYRLPLTKA